MAQLGRWGVECPAGATLTGVLLALSPLPLLFTSVTVFPGGDGWWRPVIAILSLICGASGALLVHRRLSAGRVLLGLFLLGTLLVSIPSIRHDPFAALLLLSGIIGAGFSVFDLRGECVRPEFSPARPRAVGAAWATVVLSLLPLWHVGAAGRFSLPIAFSALATIGSFLVWAQECRWRKFASGYGFALVVALSAAVVFRCGMTAVALFGSLGILLITGIAARFSGRHDSWWVFLLSHPARVMFLSFLGLCVAGALLLSLPAATCAGGIAAIDAAFTATSAVCVTGLSVCDTGGAFSLFGQLVIMVLIQLGGLGIMSIATVGLHVIGRRLSLRQEQLMSSMTDTGRRDLISALKLILRYTFLVEAAGTMLLAALFHGAGMPPLQAIYNGVFTAISGFCNAGFMLQSNSLVGFQQNPLILYTVAALIILGGLAPATALALPRLLRHEAVPVGAQLALVCTGWLLVCGTALMLLFEWNGVLGDLDAADKFHNAFFQSVTLRTAGFNSVDLGSVGTQTLLWMILWMFIGGSPGSTAGGIKTTTLAVLFLTCIAEISGNGAVIIRNRRIAGSTVNRAVTITAAAALVLAAAVMMLIITQPLPARELLFEAASALGTVGLSLGTTPELDGIGKVVIILTMFIGRIGPMTLFLLLREERGVSQSRCPVADISLT